MNEDRLLILATVVTVKDNKFYYAYCKMCYSKISPLSEGKGSSYRCYKCGCYYSDHDRCDRYRLHLRISHYGYLSDITVFGECLQPIFGISATQLRKMLSTSTLCSSNTNKEVLFRAVEKCLIGSMFYFGLKTASVEQSTSQQKSNSPVRLEQIIQQNNSNDRKTMPLVAYLMRRCHMKDSMTVFDCITDIKTDIKATVSKINSYEDENVTQPVNVSMATSVSSVEDIDEKFSIGIATASPSISDSASSLLSLWDQSAPECIMGLDCKLSFEASGRIDLLLNSMGESGDMDYSHNSLGDEEENYGNQYIGHEALFGGHNISAFDRTLLSVNSDITYNGDSCAMNYASLSNTQGALTSGHSELLNEQNTSSTSNNVSFAAHNLIPNVKAEHFNNVSDGNATAGGDSSAWHNDTCSSDAVGSQLLLQGSNMSPCVDGLTTSHANEIAEALTISHVNAITVAEKNDDLLLQYYHQDRNTKGAVNTVDDAHCTVTMNIEKCNNYSLPSNDKKQCVESSHQSEAQLEPVMVNEKNTERVNRNGYPETCNEKMTQHCAENTSELCQIRLTQHCSKQGTQDLKTPSCVQQLTLPLPTQVIYNENSSAESLEAISLMSDEYPTNVSFQDDLPYSEDLDIFLQKIENQYVKEKTEYCEQIITKNRDHVDAIDNEEIKIEKTNSFIAIESKDESLLKNSCAMTGNDLSMCFRKTEHNFVIQNIKSEYVTNMSFENDMPYSEDFDLFLQNIENQHHKQESETSRDNTTVSSSDSLIKNSDNIDIGKNFSVRQNEICSNINESEITSLAQGIYNVNIVDGDEDGDVFHDNVTHGDSFHCNESDYEDIASSFQNESCQNNFFIGLSKTRQSSRRKTVHFVEELNTIHTIWNMDTNYRNLTGQSYDSSNSSVDFIPDSQGIDEINLLDNNEDCPCSPDLFSPDLFSSSSHFSMDSNNASEIINTPELFSQTCRPTSSTPKDAVVMATTPSSSVFSTPCLFSEKFSDSLNSIPGTYCNSGSFHMMSGHTRRHVLRSASVVLTPDLFGGKSCNGGCEDEILSQDLFDDVASGNDSSGYDSSVCKKLFTK
uniref:Dentin sialophosphoprotein-like n=1 Tax=Saccoglossus kowalevskii TaxID=10224 RepID=A0ABM0MVK1_SACKO|nr:PREDICTED: dentin sialophosphoprotein-like [Saccoglossus kowalevskii]